MNRIEPKNGCIGCSACYAACPKDAITMGQNERGFYVPIIDEKCCIDCGVCSKICPLNHVEKAEDRTNAECQYGFIKNHDVIQKSTSGGLFYALAEKAIGRGGIVCGCVWDPQFTARHICAESMEEVLAMRGSKYVQSNMGDCFPTIKRALKEDRFVLFCGTPCQTTALHSYLGKEYDHLVTCALICGGVPSPKVFEYYKNALEKNENSKITYLHMRSKANGWIVPHIELTFENGKRITEVLLTRNLYGTNFGQGLFINEDCMQCRFKLETVRADVLIGDHWGIRGTMLKESKNMGASTVITLTKRGKAFLLDAADDLYLEDGNLNDVIDSHLVLTKNHIPNPYRDEFFKDLNEENILTLLDKYYQQWRPKNPVKKLVHEFLYRTKLYTPLFKLRWKIKKR